MSNFFKALPLTFTGATLVYFNGKSQETEMLINSRSSIIVKDLDLEKSFSFRPKPISSRVAYNSLRTKERSSTFYRPMVAKQPNLSLYAFKSSSTYFDYKEPTLGKEVLCVGLQVLGAVLQAASR